MSEPQPLGAADLAGALIEKAESAGYSDGLETATDRALRGVLAALDAATVAYHDDDPARAAGLADGARFVVRGILGGIDADGTPS